MGVEEMLADICYECEGYGDDYYFDNDGELVCACDSCWVTEQYAKMYDDDE